MNRASIVYGLGTNPYVNLALEHELLQQVEEDEVILYLWQNAHTVVIGRNQNAYKECHVGNLQKDGGHLARRLSGGGAVYHDMGNLNFTFIMSAKEYDLQKQMEVIVQAVNTFDITAKQTGRNDITVDGKKFSGNAFYQSGGKAYHHGTLLIKVNTKAMSRYLQVDEKKIQSKGIQSVESRVVNLQDLEETITVERLTVAMVEAFEKVYGMKANLKAIDAMAPSLQKKIEKYGSNEWIFGQPFAFTWKNHHRFSWGDLLLEMKIEKEAIAEVRAYSDAMDEQLIRQIPSFLVNRPLNKVQMEEGLLPIKEKNPQMYQDVLSLLEKESFYKEEIG